MLPFSTINIVGAIWVITLIFGCLNMCKIGANHGFKQWWCVLDYLKLKFACQILIEEL